MVTNTKEFFSPVMPKTYKSPVHGTSFNRHFNVSNAVTNNFRTAVLPITQP